MVETATIPALNVTPETLANIAHARHLAPSVDVAAFYPANSIGDLLNARAAVTPDKNWLTYYDESGRAGTYTYREFAETTRRLAGWMQTTAGLQPGDRLATLMVNDPRTVLAYFAAWTLGVTVVPINPSEDADRIGYILHHCAARALLVPEENFAQWEKFSVHDNQMETEGTPPVVFGVPASLCDAGQETPAAFWQGSNLTDLPELSTDTECLIVYTSGTTGPPKGVVLEQGNLLADAQAIADWMGFGGGDRAMNVLPLHHVNGTVVTLMTPLVSGGSVVINRKFHAQTFWQTLADERCTWVSVVPTILAFLCERHDDLAHYDLSEFRRILCGAGPLTVDLARRFYATFGLRIMHGYGLSETTCYSCFLPPEQTLPEYEHWLYECGFPCIGCPLPVNDMAIHDANGQALPPDARGEIVIRGLNVMRYYFQRPDVNRDTFAHGWFRSGDEGFYSVGTDGRAYFFITGRLKELIIRGGINLSPFDVDEVLNAIPGVRAAMAVGFENNFYGEEVGAYVQLEAGQTLTEAEILFVCRQKLPFPKSPKVVVFGDTFPVTSTGKYQRSKLRPLFAAWKDTQFREQK